MSETYGMTPRYEDCAASCAAASCARAFAPRSIAVFVDTALVAVSIFVFSAIILGVGAAVVLLVNLLALLAVLLRGAEYPGGSKRSC